jgi:hypothetical protein
MIHNHQITQSESCAVPARLGSLTLSVHHYEWTYEVG